MADVTLAWQPMTCPLLYNRCCMSASFAPKKSPSIITPRVRRAQYELIEALKESLAQSDMTREAAEGRLSALMGEVWNEVEHVAAVTMPSRSKL